MHSRGHRQDRATTVLALALGGLLRLLDLRVLRVQLVPPLLIRLQRRLVLWLVEQRHDDGVQVVVAGQVAAAVRLQALRHTIVEWAGAHVDRGSIRLSGRI